MQIQNACASLPRQSIGRHCREGKRGAGITEKKERGLGKNQAVCRQEKENEESSKLRSYQVGKYLSIVDPQREGWNFFKALESQRALSVFF